MASQRKDRKTGRTPSRKDCPAVSAAIRDAHVPKWVREACERETEGVWMDFGGDEPMSEPRSYATAVRNQPHHADLSAHSDNESEEIIRTIGGGD